MNKYIEFNNETQKLWNEFPIFYAFSNEQFEKNISKLGLTMENIDQIVSTGFGGYIHKKDKQRYIDFWDSRHKAKMILLKDNQVLYDAILYELANHEYVITNDYTDAINAVGIPMDELLTNKQRARILKKATDEYLQNAEIY